MVVTRKTAVQPGIRRARHRPIVTTTPQAMAMRLIATCSRVKAPVDIPRIMGATMRLPLKSWAIAGQASARGDPANRTAAARASYGSRARLAPRAAADRNETLNATSRRHHFLKRARWEEYAPSRFQASAYISDVSACTLAGGGDGRDPQGRRAGGTGVHRDRVACDQRARQRLGGDSGAHSRGCRAAALRAGQWRTQSQHRPHAHHRRAAPGPVW